MNAAAHGWHDPLAEVWDLTAWHEAGHAVAAVVQGLPVLNAKVRRAGGLFGGGPGVSGSVRHDRLSFRMLSAGADLDKLIVTALAGPEVEARCLAAASGRPLHVVRAEVEQDQQDSDFANVARYLQSSALTRADADCEASALVSRWWDVIEEVAAQLAAYGKLSGAEIREAVRAAPPRPPGPDWRLALSAEPQGDDTGEDPEPPAASSRTSPHWASGPRPAPGHSAMEAPTIGAARQVALGEAAKLRSTALASEQFENDLIAGGMAGDMGTMAAVQHAQEQTALAAAAWDHVAAELSKHAQGEEYAASGYAASTGYLGP
jgi:hypothetical protein